MAISLIHLKRLPRLFRARNDIVKIYIAFILFQSIVSLSICVIKKGFRDASFKKNIDNMYCYMYIIDVYSMYTD